MIHSNGTLKTYGLSADHTEIDWGSIYTNSSYPHSVTLTNTGSEAGVLTMSTENLPTYLALSWDAEAYSMAGYEVKIVTFTLTTAEDAPAGDFSFNITVTLAG